MKKLIYSFIVAAALLVAIPSQAQIKFGVKGGLNLTEMSFSKDDLKSSNQSGFFIGPTAKFAIPLVGLGVDAALLFDQRDAELGGKDISQKSINIPVNLRYNIGLGSIASVYLAAGPQWGFNIGDKDFNWDDTASYNINNSTFSVNLGAGVSLLKHLEIGFVYNIVCGKTGEITVWDVAGEAIGSKNNRTNAWQISAAYYF